MSERVKGTVRVIKAQEGYGFIQGDDGVDRFMHRSSMERTSGKGFRDLLRDDRVEFTHVDSEKGPRAIEVRVI